MIHRLTKSTVVSLALALLTPTVSTAAAQVIAFQADFNQDMVGFAPNASPPGDPDGDQIRIVLTGGAAFVWESSGTLTDQPLFVDRDPGKFAIFQAVLDPDLRLCNGYTVEWKSLVHQTDATFACALHGSDGSILTTIGFQPDGSIFMVTPANPLSVGYTIGVHQLFAFTVDMEAKTVSLSIDGVPLSEATEIPFYDSNAPDLDMLQISGSGSNAQQYVIDDLMITGTGCGQVETKLTSWAQMKADFR